VRGVEPLLAGRLFLLLAALLFPALSVHGQALPTIDFTGKPGEKRPELLEDIQRPTLPTLTLPSPAAPTMDNASPFVKSFFVKKIVVAGSTVFSPEEIARVTAPYENRNLTMEGLESLRRELTLLYVSRGYINSGAVIPDQTVTDGQLALRIVEGKLSQITIEGNRWFGESYLRDRIALGAGVPVNILRLQDRLRLMQQDPRIERIHAELRPGAIPGESELKVRVVEKSPFSVGMAFNNYQSPSIGAETGLFTFADQNLTGHGDVLSFTYGYSRGVNPLIDTWYAAPVNAYDTTLSFRYRNTDQKVVDGVFAPLDIVSKTESFEVALRQPVYRTLSQELTLSLSLQPEEEKTYLLGEPFSFSPGMENGKGIAAPLRFGQEWIYRSQRQVIAARSRFSFGLDIMGATTNAESNVPDGRFFAWLGQFQWVRVLDFLDMQLMARTDIQLSADPLLPIEQMGVGGRYTVRGYRENLLTWDEVFIASLETRIPLVQNERWAEYLQVAPFFDYGWGRDKGIPTIGPTNISSIGAGLRWGASLIKSPLQLRSDAEIYWGYQLRTVPDTGGNLQDDGISFQIAVSAVF